MLVGRTGSQCAEHFRAVGYFRTGLPDGARVVSVDLKLRSDALATFEPLAEVAGWNPETGDSMGHVYRVRKAG